MTSKSDNLKRPYNRRLVLQLTALIMAQGAAVSSQAQSTNSPSPTVIGGTNAPAASLSTTNAPAQLPDVVVTGKKEEPAPSYKVDKLAAPKFTQPILDTPKTVVAIPKELYTEQGAVSLTDVLRNTPGITMQAGEGGNANATSGDSFFMRGFDTSGNIFIDGVRDNGSYSRDVFNLEQVEISKGPSGSDVGRGAASGYVNLVSKVPTAEAFYTGQTSFGSGDMKRTTVDINQPLKIGKGDNWFTEGTSLRLNGMWQDSDVPGRSIAQQNRWGIAPSLVIGLGTPTRLYLSYQHLVENSIPDYGLPGALFPTLSGTAFTSGISRSTYYGFVTDFDDATSDSFTARLEHDLGEDSKITNQTRYSDTGRNAIVTGPGTSPTSYNPVTGLLTRSHQGNKRDTETFSNQTTYNTKVETGSVEHDISAGLELTEEKSTNPLYTSVTLPAIPIGSPNPYVPVGIPKLSGAYNNGKVDTAAIYANETLKLGKKFQLDGGVRLEHYDLSYVQGAAATGAITNRLSGTGDLVSWKVGGVFKPVENGSIYGAYGTSMTPPGNVFTLSPATGNQNNPDAQPQETDSIEFGVKWDFFKGRLSTTASIFQTKNNKTVYNDPILGPIPAGAQTVRGTEFGITGKITEEWQVFGGLAYLDSKYDQGLAAQTGAGLPLVPDWSANLWTTYRLPFGVTLGGGIQYMGEADRLQALTATAAPPTMPSYWLANAMVSYDINKHFTLRANVNNLFDERYVASFNNNGGRFTYGAPRTFLLTAIAKF